MARVNVPDEQEKRILRENGLDPDRYGVVYRDDATIHLLNYDTRDDVVIRKGDRTW